ncbi:hypothetical protein BDN72DRAFT_900973 [Pluteus cervinus]|uniref:Uncharacterized protein n=1 Tax=Pluteus cervinus TaxID=181527 RepID=A0ACD3AHW8_9AGAR|nr:hypothetical protein BDN72DRAFT_900973 [Pluteus cervinus]
MDNSDAEVVNSGGTTAHDNKNTHPYNGAANTTHGNVTNSSWDHSFGKRVDNSYNLNTYNGGNRVNGGTVNGNVTAQTVQIHSIVHGTPSHEQKTPEQKFREDLALRAVRSASYDAEERGDPPKCHSQTRLAIQESLNPWPSSRTADPVRLISGWTGTGKTTIAQTMAEYWAEQGWLAAVFFFSRSEEDRSSTAKFAGTILHQLLQTHNLSIGSLAPFTTSQVSWSQVVDVLRSALPLPMVIIIDGLDECRNHKEQEKLLRDILNSLGQIGPFIKFLISCRPERHLEKIFEEFASNLDPAYRIHLGESAEDNRDIRTFLRLSFDVICQDRREDRAISIKDGPWPSDEQIEELVDRASGQFIFASTAIAFIDDEYQDPVKLLNLVLQRQTSSFKAIDSLYLVILQRLEDKINERERPEGCQLMRNLLLHVNTHPSSSSDIAHFWFEDEVEIDILVKHLRAVLVRRGDAGLIQFRHNSFHDFLVRPSAPPHAFSLTEMNPVSKFFFSLRMLVKKTGPSMDFLLLQGSQYLEYAYLYHDSHPLVVLSFDEEARRVHQRYDRSTFGGCGCLPHLDTVLADLNSLQTFKSCGSGTCIVDSDLRALCRMIEMPVDQFTREWKSQQGLRPIS